MKVNEAITAVMAAVGGVAKSRQNSAQNYRFRGIDDMYAAFQPALVEQGVFTAPEVLDVKIEERENAKGTVLRFVLLTVKYRIYGPEGDHVEAVVVGEAMDSGDKAANKAMSAAHKYLFLQLFCPPTEVDDADGASHELAARRPQQSALEQRIARLVAETREAQLTGWVKDNFGKPPWTSEQCDAIETKLADLSESDADAQPELVAVGAPTKDTADLAGYSEEPF